MGVDGEGPNWPSRPAGATSAGSRLAPGPGADHHNATGGVRWRRARLPDPAVKTPSPRPNNPSSSPTSHTAPPCPPTRMDAAGRHQGARQQGQAAPADCAPQPRSTVAVGLGARRNAGGGGGRRMSRGGGRAVGGPAPHKMPSTPHPNTPPLPPSYRGRGGDDGRVGQHGHGRGHHLGGQGQGQLVRKVAGRHRHGQPAQAGQHEARRQHRAVAPRRVGQRGKRGG